MIRAAVDTNALDSALREVERASRQSGNKLMSSMRRGS